MENIVGDEIGLVHTISSFLALIFGTSVLIMKKGTTTHKKAGYAYVVSMVILIITAFMIYRLFKGWGLFHYATIVSLLTLMGGMISIWTKKPVNNWKSLHLSFMYWSVMGLYAAFIAEILTRIPQYIGEGIVSATSFYSMTGIAIFIVMGFAQVLFRKLKKRWEEI